MHNDLPFRIAVLAMLMLTKLTRARKKDLVGWKASWPGFKKNPVDTIILMVFGFSISISTIVYVFFPTLLEPFCLDVPTWLRWIGVPVGLSGLALLCWADHCLGRNLSVTLQLKEDHTLVEDGPYRWVRHPIYSAVLIICVSVFLLSANGLVGGLWFGMFLLLVITRVPKEERMMIGQFGDEYRSYMLRTGRILPRLLPPRG